MALNNQFTTPNCTSTAAVVTPYNWNPPTPQQNVLASQNADGKLRVDQVFGNDVNPKTLRTYRAGAEDCVRICREVCHLEPCSKAVDSQIIKSNLQSYTLSIQNGVVAKTIFNTCYGWNLRMRTSNHSFDSLAAKLDRDLRDGRANAQEEVDFFNNHVVPLIDYVFNWVIDAQSHVRFTIVMSQNIHSFVTHVKKQRQGRCSEPVWSNRYVEDRVLVPNDSAICNGHMLDYVLILDQVVEGPFVNRLTSSTHFVNAAENLQNQLAGVQGLRLYQHR